MSPSNPQGAQHRFQSVLIKRFGMAVATYALVALVIWVAVYAGLYRGSMASIQICTALVVISQLTFLGIFHSGLNLRLRDPSLTEVQILVALALHTYLLANFSSGRGALLTFYVVIMIFGVFQLRPRVFIRCAFLAFFAFVGVLLWEAYRFLMDEPAMALLQSFILFIALAWLCLFSGYVHALRQRMRQRRFALQAHQDTMRGMMRQLEDLAATDELTGLFNRRHFLKLATCELEALCPGVQHGLALIDLDHFKHINDQHGHAAGDRVLQTFASVAQACLRDGDILARYGGEEFVLLLPGCDGDRLTSCCERLREAFANSEPLSLKSVSLSLSVGMTLLCPGDELNAALQRADQALYRAKRGGRNRCDAAWEAADA